MKNEEKVNRSKLGKRNRAKGHNAERTRAKRFQDLGYEFCKTSRNASKLLDDSKVDLAFIPWNVQIKAVQSGLNYQKIFEEMEELLKKNFPPTDLVNSYPSVIIHDRGRKDSQKHVILKEKDFMEIIKELTECRKKNS